MTDEPRRDPAPLHVPPHSSWYKRGERLIPWGSLALSISGVWAMDRHETQGPWVAGAAALGWIVLVLVSLTRRALETPTAGPLHKVAHFAADSATQSAMHLSLFFSAPFYLEACAWTPAQCAFGVVFVIACALTLWDPLCSKIVAHPLGGPSLMAFASFVGSNAALPMLGMSNRHSVWLSALGVGLAIPLTRFLQGARGRHLRGTMLVGLLLPTLLLAGGIRAVPPAPLRVVQAGIGTQVVDRTLLDPSTHLTRAPGTLVCFSAIRAPLGLKDALEHVWTHNGKVIARIALRVRGGRQKGFRTWSRVHPPRQSDGNLRCEVVTELGQNLGGAVVQLGPRIRHRDIPKGTKSIL